jgi:hypothetical protein
MGRSGPPGRRGRQRDAGGDDATRDLIRSALRAGMSETGFLHYRVIRNAFLAAAPAPQA